MTTDNIKILKNDYLPFLEEIKGKIKSARIQAYRRVNKEIILLYWDIGKKIVERQEQFGWGKSVVEKLRRLVAEIPWGQNLVIMSRVKDNKKREFYIRKTIKFGWTRDVLIHQIEAEAHLEIDAKKMHNFPQALPGHLAEQADKALKDSYILDFLDISKPLQERQLELLFAKIEIDLTLNMH